MSFPIRKPFHPILRKSFVGFDDIFSEMERIMNNLEGANSSDDADLFSLNYSHYNLYETDNGMVLQLAVAGFNKDELKVWEENGKVFIQGDKVKDSNAPVKESIHHGISSRQFKRAMRFSDDYVLDRAKLENGILNIFFVRKPQKTPNYINIS